MSPLNLARILSSVLVECIVAAYSDDDDRIIDQAPRPRGYKAASMAEVMARPLGPIPSSLRLVRKAV